jgi:hypothetical protein
MITGSNGVQRITDLSSVQTFVWKLNQAVTSRGFLATVGSGGLKWTCKCGYWCEGNWWKDTGISFYTFHYYSWMVENQNIFDPFNLHPADWCFAHKPALIGESPAWTDASLKGQMTVSNQFYLANKNGWMGVMPWADKAYQDKARWSDIAAGLKCSSNWSSCRSSWGFLQETRPESLSLT